MLLIRVGRREHSIALEADGHHLMTDVWTSAGVIVGVALVFLTGWLRLDPLVALAVAVHIVWIGLRLMRRSWKGLLDAAISSEDTGEVTKLFTEYSKRYGVSFHALRTRRRARAASSRSTSWCPMPGPWPRRTSSRRRSRRASARWCRTRPCSRTSSRSRTPPPTTTRSWTGKGPCPADDVGQSALARSRRTYFWILPVAVVGTGPNTTFFGILKRARFAGTSRCSPARWRSLGLQLHEGARRLAPFLVGPRHHGGELRRRVLVERDLDFDRGDVLAARDDDVLLAVLDLDIVARVPHRQVAGVHPAASNASAVAFRPSGSRASRYCRAPGSRRSTFRPWAPACRSSDRRRCGLPRPGSARLAGPYGALSSRKIAPPSCDAQKVDGPGARSCRRCAAPGSRAPPSP